MSELKEFDDTGLDNEDEYETPWELYADLCETYNIHPHLDVAANRHNSKTDAFLDDALYEEWNHYGEDVWCNPPHSKTEEFVLRADWQWDKHNINIMMIVPANAICAHYFDVILEHAEYHRISGRPHFLRNGIPTKWPSRNSYFVVIWRARGT